MKLTTLTRALVLGVLAPSVLLHAQITFSFTYTGTANVGFNDPTNGAARKAALESAASTVASWFSTTAPRTITFSVNSYSTNNTTLASASSNAISDSAGFHNTVVQNKILTGTDSNGTDVDGEINWNWHHLWDLSDNVASNQYDFKSTVMHEVLHAFGFTSFVTDPNATTNPNSSNTNWTIFDRFLTTSNGTGLINSTTHAWAGQNSALTGNPGIYFSGTNAMAANGGNRVSIFSPSPWQSGSSGSHTNDSSYAGTLMIAATATGPSARTLSSIEIGILKDLGYTVTAIPEPSTYAAFLGVTVLGVVIVRRRRKSAATVAIQ